MWRVWIEIAVSFFRKCICPSPSVWRVWIEIGAGTGSSESARRSPSVWRVWIEIYCSSLTSIIILKSPSVWRVWIEIRILMPHQKNTKVTLRVEGVD